MQTEKLEKKVYATPQLIVHGTVEEITASTCKQVGSSDGFYLAGAGEITNCS